MRPFLVVSGYGCAFPEVGYESLDPQSFCGGLSFCCLSSASGSNIDGAVGGSALPPMLRRWRWQSGGWNTDENSTRHWSSLMITEAPHVLITPREHLLANPASPGVCF